MSASTVATDNNATVLDRQLKILSPPKTSSPIPDLPEEVYKLSANEVKQLYQSAVDRRQALESQPLKTQKMRDVEEQEKLKKYPKTTIRVRMPDHTIVQAVFYSKEKGICSIDITIATDSLN
ncbi:hypothetical protein BDF20DRAFT_820674 [Mycotypha africana]|uniref:uncharacterized protein n=1 Tax=Mycotypha africana TaxID=64632 RepID=UPI002301058F|nr:uncharacterized protein BDF20DRAFT_820674 [Mycotypha africana]KAI8977184.1 hypothetical protein BDF20DRAFT_820674 [Mycotypha africana]